MKKPLSALLLLVLAIMSAAQERASHGAAAPNSSSNLQLTNVAVLAELTKALDARKARRGDVVAARVVQEVRVGDKVIAKGSMLVGQVEEVRLLAKGEVDSALAVVFGKMISKDGRESWVPTLLQAIGAGMAAESDEDAPDPSTHVHDRSACVPGMDTVRSTMGGSNSASASHPRRLTAASVGVMGISDITLSSHVTNDMVTSLITSAKRNVKLESGTQLVLRLLVVSPQPSAGEGR